MADLVMSFDNILAVVQVAHGDLVLLAVGLAVSIPIVIAGAALFAGLLERLPILIWAGSALLGWVAAQTIVRDDAIARLISGTGRLAESFEWLAGGAGAVLIVTFGGLWRRWCFASSAASARLIVIDESFVLLIPGAKRSADNALWHLVLRKFVLRQCASQLKFQRAVPVSSAAANFARPSATMRNACG